MLIVEPASFKSDTYIKTPWDDRNPIPDYADLVTQIQEVLRVRGSTVKGDPHKGMSVVADVVRGEGVAKGKEWPLYLLLGDQAISGFKEKAEIILQRTREWEPIMANLNCDE